LIDYFDRKKSQVKAVFLKEIFKRRRWIGHAVFWERCGSAKSDFWRVKAPYLVMEILKSQATESEGKNSSKKIVKSNLDNIFHAMKELVTNMRSKPARRAEVCMFCVKLLWKHNLVRSSFV
jgi:DNA polymerase phi